MQTLSLRSANRSVSRIAFGAEPLGGYEWGDLDFAEIERAVGVAIDAGVTLFDTADCYGKGESEQRLGRALGVRRHEVAISSKFGVRFDAQNRAWYDNSASHMRAALERSLKRLGTDYVDLYQLHWPDGNTPLEEVFETLEALREEGKIRSYGVTNVPPGDLFPFAELPGLASFSLQFSVVYRNEEAAIQALCAKGLRFLAWGSLAQGLLSGRYGAEHRWPKHDRRRRAQYEHFHGEKLQRNLSVVEELQAVALAECYSGPVIAALRFILDRIPGSIAIVGVKSCAQILQNVEAGERPMQPASLDRLATIGGLS